MGRRTPPNLERRLLRWAHGLGGRPHYRAHPQSVLLLMGTVVAVAAAAPAPAQPPSAPPAPPMAPPSSPGDGGSWTVIVGIVLGLTASIGINLGNNLQALGLSIQAQSGEEKKPRVWWIGAVTFGVASLINFGAFGFAPAAVLAPLESIQFVTNLIFGKVVNKAIITNKMYGGSALVVSGCIIAVSFGPNKVAKFTEEDLRQFWYATGWIVYCSFLVGFFCAAQLVHLKFERARTLAQAYKHDSIILPVTFATSSAIVGSMCVVMSKCMSELTEIFVTGPNGPDVLASPLFYISLVLTVIFLCAWLYRLNAALGKYDPLFIIPLLQSNYILFSISSGGVYFQEFGMLDAKAWIFFMLGIGIMFGGLFLLAPSGTEHDDMDHDDMETAQPFPPMNADAPAPATDAITCGDALSVECDAIPRTSVPTLGAMVPHEPQLLPATAVTVVQPPIPSAVGVGAYDRSPKHDLPVCAPAAVTVEAVANSPMPDVAEVALAATPTMSEREAVARADPIDAFAEEEKDDRDLSF